VVRHFKSAATKVQKPGPFAFRALQVIVKLVIHEASLPSYFDQARVFHDLQMMRDIDDFCLQQLGDVTHGQFSISQRIDDPETMRITQRLQSLSTKIRIKDFLRHCLGSLSKDSEIHQTIA